LSQPIVEGRKLDGLAEICPDQVEEGGEMDAVKATEGMRFREIAGSPPDFHRDVNHEVVLPVLVEIGLGSRVLFG
jgi:hypothetical protein